MIKRRSLLIYILLTIVTFGVYAIYWQYRFAKDMNALCEGDGRKTRGVLFFFFITMVTFGIYAVVWYYGVGNRLRDNAPRYGASIATGGGIVLLWQTLGALLFGIGPFVALYLLMKGMNTLGDVYNQRAQAGEGNPPPYGNAGNAAYAEAYAPGVEGAANPYATAAVAQQAPALAGRSIPLIVIGCALSAYALYSLIITLLMLVSYGFYGLSTIMNILEIAALAGGGVLLLLGGLKGEASPASKGAYISLGALALYVIQLLVNLILMVPYYGIAYALEVIFYTRAQLSSVVALLCSVGLPITALVLARREHAKSAQNASQGPSA